MPTNLVHCWDITTTTKITDKVHLRKTRLYRLSYLEMVIHSRSLSSPELLFLFSLYWFTCVHTIKYYTCTMTHTNTHTHKHTHTHTHTRTHTHTHTHTNKCYVSLQIKAIYVSCRNNKKKIGGATFHIPKSAILNKHLYIAVYGNFQGLYFDYSTYFSPVSWDFSTPNRTWMNLSFENKCKDNMYHYEELSKCRWAGKTMDSQPWGPWFKSACSGGTIFSSLGQGTLSSLPSPLRRT